MQASLHFSLPGLALAALLAGALVPLQAGSNAALGQALGHPLWASVVSLLLSMLVVLPVLLALRASAPDLSAALHAPWWAWTGGVAGIVYITAALLLVPRMGAASFMVCVIAGQMLVSVLMDHFGLMRLPVKEINAGRMVGMALMVVGMLLVLRFGASPAGK